MNISCTQCGGTIDLAEGEHFLICPYCSSALYLDKSRVVFHYVVNPTLNGEQSEGNLKRWMAGNDTVKDLDTRAVVTGRELFFFPLWRFVASEDSALREYTEPAASFSIPDLHSPPLSGGNLEFYSPERFRGIPLKEPDVLLDSALKWIQTRGVKPDLIRETNLIHVPFYLFKYRYEDSEYRALVDAASGRVIASLYPARVESPFWGIAVAGVSLFFLAGVLMPTALIRLIVYAILAVPFAAASYFVASRY